MWEGPCSGPDNIDKLCGIKLAYPTGEFTNYLNSLIKETSALKKITLWRYPSDSVKSESGPDCENSQIEADLNSFVSDQLTATNRLIDMSEEEVLNATAAATYYNTSRYFVQLCRVKKSPAELDIMRKVEVSEFNIKRFEKSKRKC